MRLSANILAFVLIWSLPFIAFGADQIAPLSRTEIIRKADGVADAQLRLLKNDIVPTWIGAVLQAGLADYSAISPKGDSYIHVLIALADKESWKPPVAPKHTDIFHADDLAIGQTYLALYAVNPDPARIAPLKTRLDQVADHLDNEIKTNGKLTWWWCDALFMAPPTMARLSQITGDQKYIDAMDHEFWRTTSALYSPADHLFYRDARFVDKPDKNGHKVFWARGNGWVVGGIVRILQYMPENYPSRPKYIQLCKDMMSKLLTLQTADGTWHSNLLYPGDAPGPETSGTAFITYAMAWGINHQLLDEKTYLPATIKGWNALLANLNSDGVPGYVQSVGYQPGSAKRQETQLYATGGFLLAAIEMQKLAPNPQ